jgi:hypothetical protein
MIERILDITQIRLLVPLPFISGFLFIILLTLKFDGMDISMWEVSIPLFVFFGYWFISAVVTGYVYQGDNDQRSVFHGLWMNSKYCMFNVFIFSGTSVCMCFFCYKCFLLPHAL